MSRVWWLFHGVFGGCFRFGSAGISVTSSMNLLRMPLCTFRRILVVQVRAVSPAKFDGKDPHGQKGPGKPGRFLANTFRCYLKWFGFPGYLIFGYFWWVFCFPVSIHAVCNTAYIGEDYLHVRYQRNVW